MISYSVFRVGINFALVLLTTIVIAIHNYHSKEIVSEKVKKMTSSGTNLETIFCRNPQSYSKSDLLHCSSARQLFLTLKEDCLKKGKVVKSEVTPKQNKTVTRLNKNSDNGDEVQEKLESSSFVDILVVTLLLVSAIVSVVELYRERLRKQNQEVANGKTPGEGKVGERRMSLVNLTVSRHARKRDSQQLENLRTSNTNTAARVPPPLIRRMSFPAQLPDATSTRGRHTPPMRQQSWCLNQSNTTINRKLSIDMSEDDSSPDRRRIRMLRRH